MIEESWCCSTIAFVVSATGACFWRVCRSMGWRIRWEISTIFSEDESLRQRWCSGTIACVDRLHDSRRWLGAYREEEQWQNYNSPCEFHYSSARLLGCLHCAFC